MEPLRRTHIQWSPILAAVAMGLLLLLSHGCSRGQVVSVQMTTSGSSPDGTPTPTGTNTNPDATPTPTNPDATPTPTATSTSPDSTPTPTATPTASDTPTPAPTPALACGEVMIRDLIISTGDPNGPQIHDRGWSVLDLANPNGSTINDLGVSPGTYTSVRFTIHKENPAQTWSVHLCGTWQGVQWDVQDDITDNVVRKDAGGVTVDSDGPGKLFVVFDSSHWFDGIDLTNDPPAPDGIVYLSHDSNLQDAMKFKQNFETSIRLANQAHSGH